MGQLTNLRALDALIGRSLSLPRKHTANMRSSLRSDPWKALRYSVFKQDLVDAMVRAYTLGFRQDGSRLPKVTRDQMRSNYNSQAGGILMQYQKFANKAIKQAADKGENRGESVREALRRFNTLGMTAPASRRMEGLFRDAMDGAYQQGVWDAAQNNPQVKGFKYKTREDSKVRHPYHTQLNSITAPKSSPVWKRYFPPWAYGCRCKAYPLKRTPAGGWTGLPDDFEVPPDDGFEGSDFNLI